MDVLETIRIAIEIFNSRELATMTWLVVFIFWLVFWKREVLLGLKDVLVAVARLWLMFLTMILYIGACIYALYKLSWWNLDLLKVTTFWFFGWAIATMMSANQTSEPDYYKKITISIFGVTVFVSFLTNFYTFPYLAELILIPFISIVAMMTALPKTQENDRAMKVLDWILIFFGLTVLSVSAFRAIRNFNEFATLGTLQEFSIPIVLSIMFIPYVVLLALFFKYEQYRFRKEYLKKDT